VDPAQLPALEKLLPLDTGTLPLDAGKLLAGAQPAAPEKLNTPVPALNKWALAVPGTLRSSSWSASPSSPTSALPGSGSTSTRSPRHSEEQLPQPKTESVVT